MPDQPGEGGRPQQNARAAGGSAGGSSDSSETVRYVNKQENPDHWAHDED
jgi:hypothetical protein